MTNIVRGFSLAEPHTPQPISRPEFMTHPDRPCKNKWGLWTSDEEAHRSAAAEQCRRCPVLQQCREWAVENGERQFVWGGIDFSQSRSRAIATGIPAKVRRSSRAREPEQTLRGAMARHAFDKPELFARLTDEARATAVRTARDQGRPWAQLAQLWGHDIAYLQELTDEREVVAA